MILLIIALMSYDTLFTDWGDPPKKAIISAEMNNYVNIQMLHHQSRGVFHGDTYCMDEWYDDGQFMVNVFFRHDTSWVCLTCGQKKDSTFEFVIFSNVTKSFTDAYENYMRYVNLSKDVKWVKSQENFYLDMKKKEKFEKISVDSFFCDTLKLNYMLKKGE